MPTTRPHPGSDAVPESGPWQTDHELQRLSQAIASEKAIAAANHNPYTAQYQRLVQEMKRYVDANRRRLGIPANYYPDYGKPGVPATASQDGSTLYDPNQNFYRDSAIGVGSVVGAGVAGAALAGPAALDTSIASGAGASSIPAGAAVPAAAGGAGTAAAIAAPPLVSAPSIADRLKQLVTNPKDLASLATLLPLLAGGGGNNPFGDSGVSDEISKSLELQRKRLEQSQPVYDTLVNMSYGMSPTRYRGEPPAGYTPNAAPEGPYAYKGPRFG